MAKEETYPIYLHLYCYSAHKNNSILRHSLYRNSLVTSFI